MDIRIKKSIDVLTRIIADLGFNNPKQFSESLDFERPERIYKILRGKTAVSRNLAGIINSKYPQYKMDWLLTGEGEMLKGEKGEEPKAEGSIAEDPKAAYGSMAAMHQDIKSLAEGMTHNFESVSRAIMLGLKNQTKILDFVEKLNAEDIKGATAKLNRFLEEQENVKK